MSEEIPSIFENITTLNTVRSCEKNCENNDSNQESCYKVVINFKPQTHQKTV